MTATITLGRWVLAGYADGRDATPWLRSPTSLAEYARGGPETQKAKAYWRGFDAALEQAYADAQAVTP